MAIEAPKRNHRLLFVVIAFPVAAWFLIEGLGGAIGSLGGVTLFIFAIRAALAWITPEG